MADHFEAEQRFRQETLAFMRQCLSPVPEDDSDVRNLKIPARAQGQMPEVGDSGSSTSSSTAADASSGSSHASMGTSTEDPSPRNSTSEPAASGGKSRRNTFRELASTIASYFRPRKDSAIEMREPEPITKKNEGVIANIGPRSPLILSFKTIADGVCPRFSAYEHRTFLLECEKFVNATEREQELRIRGVLPSLEEYAAMRIDTGAVAMCLALHE